MQAWVSQVGGRIVVLFEVSKALISELTFDFIDLNHDPQV
jgi:hypothetical protein